MSLNRIHLPGKISIAQVDTSALNTSDDISI